MKRNWIITTALGLGLTTLVPAFALADRYDGPRDNDRRDVRVERTEVREVRHDDRTDRDRNDRDRDFRDGRQVEVRTVVRDVDTVVPVTEVPGSVIDAAQRIGNGRRIEDVRFVRHDGQEFYVVNMDRRDKLDIAVRIAPDGHLLDLVRDADRDGK